MSSDLNPSSSDELLDQILNKDLSSLSGKELEILFKSKSVRSNLDYYIKRGLSLSEDKLWLASNYLKLEECFKFGFSFHQIAKNSRMKNFFKDVIIYSIDNQVERKDLLTGLKQSGITDLFSRDKDFLNFFIDNLPELEAKYQILSPTEKFSKDMIYRSLDNLIDDKFIHYVIENHLETFGKMVFKNALESYNFYWIKKMFDLGYTITEEMRLSKDKIPDDDSFLRSVEVVFNNTPVEIAYGFYSKSMRDINSDYWSILLEFFRNHVDDKTILDDFIKIMK